MVHGILATTYTHTNMGFLLLRTKRLANILFSLYHRKLTDDGFDRSSQADNKYTQDFSFALEPEKCQR